MTAAPPHECPIRMSAGVARVAMNSHALTMSLTLTVNDPSPQSPSDPPRPSASKRSMPIPSAASCLQLRAAPGESLPSVKPCANTPQPRTALSGTLMTPARFGPAELRKVTRSPMVEIYHDPDGVRKVRQGAAAGPIARVGPGREGVGLGPPGGEDPP